jgi:hypothetical protein
MTDGSIPIKNRLFLCASEQGYTEVTQESTCLLSPFSPSEWHSKGCIWHEKTFFRPLDGQSGILDAVFFCNWLGKLAK